MKTIHMQSDLLTPLAFIQDHSLGAIVTVVLAVWGAWVFAETY